MYYMSSGIEVRSMQFNLSMGMPLPNQHSKLVYPTYDTTNDTKWETYIGEEGLELRVTQPGYKDVYVKIPTRAPTVFRTFQRWPPVSLFSLVCATTSHSKIATGSLNTI